MPRRLDSVGALLPELWVPSSWLLLFKVKTSLIKTTPNADVLFCRFLSSYRRKSYRNGRMTLWCWADRGVSKCESYCIYVVCSVGTRYFYKDWLSQACCIWFRLSFMRSGYLSHWPRGLEISLSVTKCKYHMINFTIDSNIL